MATIIVDDQSQEIQYLCSVSKQTVSGSYSNNTWTSITSPDCINGWFKHTFHGTAVSITAAMAQINQNYTVKIDDGPWVTQTGQGSFQSPTLPDGQHTVTYAAGNPDLLPTFDFLTITAGPSTPLENRTLVVDDNDTSVRYTGAWSIQPSTPLEIDFSTGLFRDTAHWSTTVGDTIELQFTGTSVSVFGIFTNITSGGNISATYTLDDGVPVLRSIPKGTLEGMPMTGLFHSDVPAGDHKLLINVTHISPPLAIGFDFITYNASFTSLASMPGYIPPTDSHKTGSASTGAIIGGVIGGVAFIAAILFLGLLWRRRGQKHFSKGGRKEQWSELKRTESLS